VRGAICIGMGQFMSQYIVPIAIGAVAIVLLQFVAIVIIMATIWAMGR
jgi:hypothetical protein